MKVQEHFNQTGHIGKNIGTLKYDGVIRAFSSHIKLFTYYRIREISEINLCITRINTKTTQRTYKPRKDKFEKKKSIGSNKIPGKCLMQFC